MLVACATTVSFEIHFLRMAPVQQMYLCFASPFSGLRIVLPFVPNNIILGIFIVNYNLDGFGLERSGATQKDKKFQWWGQKLDFPRHFLRKKIWFTSCKQKVKIMLLKDKSCRVVLLKSPFFIDFLSMLIYLVKVKCINACYFSTNSFTCVYALDVTSFSLNITICVLRF